MYAFIQLHVTSSSCALYSYTHYDQKPVSISEVLALTLKFVHSEGGREDEGEKGSSGKRRRTSDNPQPKFATLSEAQTLDSCLRRWITEVDQDMQGRWLRPLHLWSTGHNSYLYRAEGECGCY